MPLADRHKNVKTFDKNLLDISLIKMNRGGSCLIALQIAFTNCRSIHSA